MLIFLTTLLSTLWSIFRSRASLENLALRHQIGVLHRSAGKRPKLTSGDRLLWICLSRLWRDWRSALAIVKPETVVAWHRAAFRLFWTWKVRCGKPGRPVIVRENHFPDEYDAGFFYIPGGMTRRTALATKGWNGADAACLVWLS